MTITIPRVFSQKRHRTNGYRRYDPSSKDKDTIRQYLLLCKPPKPLEAKFEMYLLVYVQTPKSWNKKKQLEVEGQYRDKVPDVDNYAKIVMDAMNGYIYKDDSQIVRAVIEKRYSINPRMEITLNEID